ncbi:hypothetical protein [Azospirillum sp. TSO5]|uniref:hypothetical protein n=1 Tax=Azospirillum sp. TSO5 TaxID=716760 RepID=UPI0011B1F1E1|nr:hypothetical protein [Azospirillum sp. TSO5]
MDTVDEADFGRRRAAAEALFSAGATLYKAGFPNTAEVAATVAEAVAGGARRLSREGLSATACVCAVLLKRSADAGEGATGTLRRAAASVLGAVSRFEGGASRSLAASTRAGLVERIDGWLAETQGRRPTTARGEEGRRAAMDFGSGPVPSAGELGHPGGIALADEVVPARLRFAEARDDHSAGLRSRLSAGDAGRESARPRGRFCETFLVGLVDAGFVIRSGIDPQTVSRRIGDGLSGVRDWAPWPVASVEGPSGALAAVGLIDTGRGMAVYVADSGSDGGKPRTFPFSTPQEAMSAMRDAAGHAAAAARSVSARKGGGMQALGKALDVSVTRQPQPTRSTKSPGNSLF